MFKQIVCLPTLSSLHSGSHLVHSSNSSDRFGVDIDLTGVQRGHNWKFSLINNTPVTFFEPIGTDIVMSIFSQRSSGEAVAGVVTETISTDRQQGITGNNPISGAVGEVFVTRVETERVNISVTDICVRLLEPHSCDIRIGGNIYRKMVIKHHISRETLLTWFIWFCRDLTLWIEI